MKVFAHDPAVVSVDADLASTSGLEAGVAAVDQRRALNVGVAEANMLCIGEGYAIQGFNAWVSTFCPFFDWKVMRRVAVGHQERLEAIAAADGWLSEGHGLDLTMLATAANFETRTNGATHMGNDDNTIFDGLAHLKIVDSSCPQQMLAIMRWIMEGNRGLVYLRVMRTPSAVLYPADYAFEFGKAVAVHDPADAAAVIVSSGRGVHEALAAAAAVRRARRQRRRRRHVVDRRRPAGRAVPVRAADLPGRTEQRLHPAESAQGGATGAVPTWPRAALQRIVAINTLGADGRPAYIHSATYEELIEAYGLTPAAIAGAVLQGARSRRGAMTRTGDPRRRRRGTQARRPRSALAGGTRGHPGQPLLDLRDRRAARRTGAPGALASERRRGHLHHPRVGTGAGRHRREPGARGHGRAVPARRGAHAPQHRTRTR